MRGDTDPNNSEISGQSNSVPVNTPATSYSSYSSYTAKDGKKSGVYELSGMLILILIFRWADMTIFSR